MVCWNKRGDGFAWLFVGRLLSGDNISARFQCPTFFFFDHDQTRLQRRSDEAPMTAQSA